MALTKGCLFALGKRLTKWFKGNETVFILLWAGLLKDRDNLVFLHSLAKGDEDVFELSVEHGTVALLVVELQDFHEVLEGATVLVLLDLGVDGQELIQLHHLGLLHLLHAELLTYGNGGVKVESPKAVGEVKGIHGVITLEVVDREGELSLLDISSTEVSHGALRGSTACGTPLRFAINLK